jgi:Zn-dependent protease with chaperone function
VNPLLVAPLLLVLAGTFAGWFLPRVASPATCVRVLTAAIVVATGGLTAALALVALVAAAEVHSLPDLVGRCRALYPGDHGVAPWAGTAALVALAIAAGNAARYLGRVRRELDAFSRVDGVEVVTAAGPVAFAVPGRPGGVVVGAELLEVLDPDERRVVLAHEQAHLDQHHHRFVRAAEACGAAFPFLVPIARQVRFNSERWADEVAAARIGSRVIVARVIAKVALLGVSNPAVSLAFESLGSSARVEALLHPRVSTGRELAIAGSAVTILTTLAGSSVQVHHLAAFLLHACRF